MEIVVSSSPEIPRLHPEPGVPRFIPRLGHGQQRLGPLLEPAGVTLTVSPLYYMAHNPELALFAQPSLGLALDPETYRRQLPVECQSKEFHALPFAGDGGFDPETSAVGEEDLAALVTSPLDLARARGATLLITAYHLAGGVGTRGRDLDLIIARHGVEHFRRQRMDEPSAHAAISVRRELYVGLAVEGAILQSETERHRLAAAYLDVGADGYWVKIAGFHERSPLAVVHACGAFLALLSSTGWPVVSVGAGHLHPGLLASGISTSIGMAECERFTRPTPYDRNDWSDGRSRPIYHPAFLRSFRAKSDRAARAFAHAPCDCGQHVEDQPPSGGTIDEHAAVVRAREAGSFLEGAIPERRRHLLARAGAASHYAADARLDYTSPNVFQCLFDGIDGTGAAEKAS